MSAGKLITIHETFENQVNATPDNIAIRFGNDQITYKQLNFKANQLALFLQNIGVKREKFVGIFIEKGIDAVIAMIAVLKAGGAFVIIDSKWSYEKIAEIFYKASIKTLIVDGINLELLKGKDFPKKLLLQIISMNMNKCKFEGVTGFCNEDYKNYSGDNLINISDSEDSAHIYFTSGSTGNSKGIVGPHSLIVHLAGALIQQFCFDENCRFSQLSNLSFDSSLRDIFIPLFCGATVCIPTGEVFSDSNKLANWINDEEITVVQCVPSIFNRIIKVSTENERFFQFKNLRYIFQAGEALNIKYLIKWFHKYHDNIQLINLYGTTETMVKSFYKIDFIKLPYLMSIPIGKPIKNTELLVMKDKKICKAHEVGTLYIRSPYLTKGYLNNYELTKKSFIQNPLHNNYIDIIYNTGDQAKYLPDGNVVLLGRNDNQVKIQGVRVEIDEIEGAIKSIQGVNEAILIVRERVDMPEIILFIVAEDDLSHDDINVLLADKIPIVCMPKHIVFLNQMPVNVNGKVDRQYLKQYKVVEKESKESFEQKSTLNITLLNIWKEVLKKDNIRDDDNFFMLGGDSLIAMQIISRIKTVLHKDIRFIDFFKNQSVKSLLYFIETIENKTAKKSGIPPLPISKYYKSSYSQERLWVLDKLDEDGVSYNISMAFKLCGEIKEDLFKEALSLTVKKHEVLRTSFTNVDGEVKQKVHNMDDHMVDFGFYDIYDIENENQVLKDAIDKIVKHKFDLTKVPLFKSQLVRLNNNQHVFIFCIHHIICDGWSLNNIMRDIIKYYKDLQKRTYQEEKISIQYKEYASWQKKIYENNLDNEGKRYWLSKLSGKLPKVNLPCDFKRPFIKTFHGNYVNYLFDKDLINDIREYCIKYNVSLFTFLLASLNVLIYKTTGQTDVIIGTPISGRNLVELEEQVGLYINTIALRSTIETQSLFVDFMRKVNTSMNEAFEYQTYPFDKLINELNIPRDTSHNALFDIMLVLQNQEKIKVEVEGVTVSKLDIENKNSKFDITFMFIEDCDNLCGKIEYNTDLFTARTIELIISHLENVFKAVIKDDAIKVDGIVMLTDKEKDYVINQYNSNEKTYPLEKTVDVLFEESVVSGNYKICIQEESQKYTYDEINKKANQLARYLLRSLDKKDSVVGIYLKRSAEFIISVLAILKSGKTFLPLDTNNPKSRNQFILENTGVKCLLTNDILGMDLNFIGKIINVSDDRINYEESYNLNIKHSSSDLAYILFTSGTTGKPKGVMIPHCGLVNYCMWAMENYVKRGSGNFAFFTSVAFDLTMTSVFIPLLLGSKIKVFGSNDVYEQLIKIFKDDDINLIKLTPSHLKILNKLYEDNTDGLKTCGTIKKKVLIVGGENLSTEVAASTYYNIGIKNIYNEYGPTEAVIGCMIKKFNANDRNEFVPIGIPAANTKIFLLDNFLRIVPFEVIGEIYIERIGLSSGYMHMSEETSKKFIQSPFDEGKILYKTGDLAYMTSNGEIMYAGRVDEQVKISGYRIELEEIENNIAHYSDVTNVAVIFDKNKELIVAYIVSKSEIIVDDLKKYLTEVIPQYMIPTKYFKVPYIPLTNNGKREIEKLKSIATPLDSRKKDKRSNSYYEIILMDACKNLLDNNCISIEDNFFDIGGSSLKAIQLIHYLKENYNLNIPIIAIFKYPSIELLGEYLRKAYLNEIEVNEIPSKSYLKEKASMKMLRIRSKGLQGDK